MQGPGSKGDLRVAALQGTLWSLLQQVGDNGIRLPVYLVLARLLPPAAFGLIALAMAYMDFLQFFRNQGVTAALVQRERLEGEHVDSAFWGGLVLGAGMGVAGFATAGLFANIADQPELAPVVRWLSIAFVLSALGAVQEALLRRDLAFQALAVRSTVGQAVAGLVAIGAALAGAGVWSLVAMVIVYQSANAALLWRVCPWRPQWRFSWDRYRELLAFGVSMLGVQLIQFARQRADSFLIGIGLGATALGLYSVARQLINGASALVLGTIAPVVWSTLTRLQDEPRRFARAIYEAAEMLALAAFPVFLGAAAVAPELVPLLLGEQWAASAQIFAALAVAETFRSVAGLNLTAMAAVGEIVWRVGLEMIVAAVTLGALVAALPFGVVAVAWAYTASLLLLIPVQLSVTFRLLDLDRRAYLRAYRMPLLGVALMLGVILVLRWVLRGALVGIPALGVLVPIGALAYVAFTWLVAPDLCRRVLQNVRIALRLASPSQG